MSGLKTLTTDLLDIAYLDDGAADAPVALLLHGWPDDPLGMVPVAERLRAAGWRTIIPWLRGFGPTSFRSSATFRDGRGVALAQDAIDLLDGLGVARCLVVGHDWGGRAAYHLAALVPERLRAIVTLGIGYSPNGKFTVPDFEQARLWWYQWLMTTVGGARSVRDDPVGFARAQWNHWSPDGWYDEAAFARTAQSFANPDWPAITLHGYRSRWREEAMDPRYAAAQATIEATAALSVPTLMLVATRIAPISRTNRRAPNAASRPDIGVSCWRVSVISPRAKLRTGSRTRSAALSKAGSRVEHGNASRARDRSGHSCRGNRPGTRCARGQSATFRGHGRDTWSSAAKTLRQQIGVADRRGELRQRMLRARLP